MMKLISGVLLSTLVVFGWGFLSMNVLGWHDNNTFGFENEDRVAEVIKDNARSGQGRYMLPHVGEIPSFLHPTEKEARQQAYEQARDDGPFMYAIVRPGKKPWSLNQAMILSAVRGLLCSLIVALILHQFAWSYGAKVGFVAALGVFAGLAAQLPTWIWFEQSTSELAVNLADLVFEWGLAGMVLAIFVGQPQVAEN